MRPTTPRVRARLRLSTLAAGCTLALVAGGATFGTASLASASTGANPNSGTASHSSTANAIDLPSGLALDKGNLWVTNKGNNSVTEISVSGKKVLQHLTSSTFGFSSPSAIIGGGNNIWVTNEGNNSVDVISVATGTLVKRLSASTFGFNKPVALTFDGPNVFVLNYGGSVTEIGRYRFGLMRRVRGSSFQFDEPVAIASSGSSIWVADQASDNQGAVTEFSASTGALQNVIVGTSGPDGNGLDVPAGLVYFNGDIWASDQASNADTAISPAGKVLSTFGDVNNNGYGFDAPAAEVAAKGEIYVLDPPSSSPMVTQFDASASAPTPNWYECDTNSPDPDFSFPDAMVLDGNDVFVASTTKEAWGPGNLITEVELTGGNNNGSQAVGWLVNRGSGQITWRNTEVLTGGQD